MYLATRVVLGLCMLTLAVAPACGQCVPPGLQDFESATPSSGTVCGTGNPGVLPPGWSNDPSGTTFWRVSTGPTPTGGTGATGDRTTGSGNFVYVETSCSSPGVWTGTLVAPCFDASGIQNPTLTFWFHMYGVSMGTLSVQQMDATGAWSTIHTIAGNQGNIWHLAAVPITPVNAEVSVRFLFVRGSGEHSDCCLDDIAFGDPSTGGNCALPGVEDFENLLPSTNIACATGVNGEIPSLWGHVLSNDSDWRVWSGPTPTSSTGPTTGVGGGQYLYMETSGCSNAQGTILTPCWDATGVNIPTIEFWYHLHGLSAGTMTLQQQLANGTWATIWSVSGIQGDQWLQAGALVQPVAGVVRCRFRYLNDVPFHADCAIDDVRFGEPSAGDWEINTAEAWFDVDGAVGSTLAPAIVARCPDTPVTLNLISNLPPAPYDVGIMLAPLVPGSAGGSVLPSGQIINISLTHSSLFWLIGGAAPNVTTPFPGSHSLVAPVPQTVVMVSGQMYVIDQTHPDSVVLAQGSQINVTAPSSVSGPTLDEEIVTIVPHGLPLCGSGSIPFFGTSYTSLNVHSNGRVSFGSLPTIDFSSSPLEAMSGNPFVGFWTDLDPSQGTVDVVAPTPTELAVTYTVPYFGEPTSTVSFTVRFDVSTGAVDLTGLLNIAANPLTWPLATAGDRQFLGLSPGLGASDPGPVTFSIGGSGGGGPNDMLYDWYDHLSGGTILVPSLMSGSLGEIGFLPNAQGGYDWIGS